LGPRAYDVRMNTIERVGASLVLVAVLHPLALDVCAAVEGSSDWPRFAGPLGDGRSPERGLLREWPKDGPAVVWRVPIKQGWNHPVVVGDDVYFGSSEEARGTAETVTCLNAKTGEERWRHTYEVGPYWQRSIGWAKGGFRATPVVDGDHLFTLGAIGHLICLERKTGKAVWQKNLWDETIPSGEKGYVFSPIVEDGKLILWYSDGARDVIEEEKRFVICRALDAKTGKRLWEFREPHRDPARMGEGQTPSVAAFNGEKCLVVTANCQLKAIRVSDGKEVWKFDCINPQGRGTTIPSPLVQGKYIVNIPDLDFTHAVEVDRSKPDFPSKIAWKKDIFIFTAIHQFRHRDGYLYGFTGDIQGASEQHASDSILKLSCVELATGKVKWSEPNFNTGVSLIEADGLLFVRSYQTLRLVEATPDGYRERGKVKTHDVWKPTVNLTDLVMPVLSRGKLYVRTPVELICYDVGGR